jgi:hypothetical protein
MKRVIAALVAVSLSVPAVAFGQDVPFPDPSEPTEPTVASTKTERPPKRVENRSRFRPDGSPETVAEAKRISRYERQRWGGPSINGRIGCESGWRHWIVNSIGAGGYLQFLKGTWNAMWPGTPRNVRLVSKRTVKKPIYKFTTYSDGSTIREKIGKIRQKRVRIREGRLPAGASRLHGWAAIRVGQRAVPGGPGPTTSWVCGL